MVLLSTASASTLNQPECLVAQLRTVEPYASDCHGALMFGHWVYHVVLVHDKVESGSFFAGSQKSAATFLTLFVADLLSRFFLEDWIETVPKASSGPIDESGTLLPWQAHIGKVQTPPFKPVVVPGVGRVIILKIV